MTAASFDGATITMERLLLSLTVGLPLVGRFNATVRTGRILIMVLSAPDHYEHRAAIRQSWADSTVRFFVGEPCPCLASDCLPWTCTCKQGCRAAPITRLDRERQEHTDLVILPMVDSYRALPRKLKEAYAWGLQNTDAKWFFKADDDMHADPAALAAQAAAWPSLTPTIRAGAWARNAPVHRRGKWQELVYTPDRYPPFPLGSRGHVVNRQFAEYVVSNTLTEYQGEDVSLGIWAREAPMPVRLGLIANVSSKCTAGAAMVGHNLRPSDQARCHH